jgi:hypothetical protein
VRELPFNCRNFAAQWSRASRVKSMEPAAGRKLMTKKLLTIPLVLAIALCCCSISAFAEGAKKNEPATTVEVKETSAKELSRTKTKLKTDMDRLMADTKAGKVAPRPQPFPQRSRNNLSKTTKIAILAAAVGSAIFLAVLFHDLSKD